MSVLNKAITHVMGELPSIILQKIVARKLHEAGIVMPADSLVAFTKHILSRNQGSFIFNDGSNDERSVSLIFTEEDAREIEEITSGFMGQIPNLIESTTKEASKKLFRSLVLKWDREHEAQLLELEQFCAGLEDRWGEGFNYLRMLLTSCREMGNEASRRYRRSNARKFLHRRWVMERLHVRACQVSDEIICLLENGFADGAMARWRTLHEVSVVASLIADGDEDLAERYILHDAVEVARQAKDYEDTQVPLGAKSLSSRQRKVIDAEYAAVIARFGPEFSNPYGWASKHLQQKKPTFKDLQIAAGSAGSSSSYKLASFNVHAGARNLFFNLSSIGDEFVPIAGRSNAGLREPGELTAYALMLVTSLYIDPGSDLDSIVMMNSMLKIRDAVPRALRRSERELAKDDRTLRAGLSRKTRSAKKKGRTEA